MGADGLDLGLLLPAVLAGAVCLLALDSPHASLQRLGAGAGRSSRGRGSGVFGHLARGRPGSPTVARRIALGAVAGVAICLLVQRLSPSAGWWPFLAWPLLVVAAVAILGGLEPASSQRRRQRLVLDLPQALELMADGLAAGLPLRGACAAVVDVFDGPVAEDLGAVLRSVELGVGEGAAWGLLAGHPQLGAAARDLSRSAESGTELVTTLRHHATAARERRRAALQQSARSVGVRSVLPLMTCFLPAFLLLGVVPTVVSAVLSAFG